MKRMIQAVSIFLAAVMLLTGCGGKEAVPVTSGPAFDTLAQTGSMELEYATEFQVDYYEGGYALIAVGDGNRYLLVPRDKQIPSGLDADIAVIAQPAERIYLAATSAMDLYRAIGGIPQIRMSSLEASGWFIPEAKAAMESGSMVYAGKYSAPDYELIYNEGCDLAVESTMIYHTPEVREQLERLGIPVFVERSSYETNPLGRMEWMKLHGLLTGRLDEAERIFRREVDALQDVLQQKPTGKTVAFFAVNSNGSVTVRKSGDYIAKTIAMAGGEYVFSDLGDDNNLSTMNLQMEAFYQGAKDADILIYNSTLNGELQTIDQLLSQSPLLADFKAVQTGNVWCTGQNLFQESMGLGKLILEIHNVLGNADAQCQYLHRLT